MNLSLNRCRELVPLPGPPSACLVQCGKAAHASFRCESHASEQVVAEMYLIAGRTIQWDVRPW